MGYSLPIAPPLNLQLQISYLASYNYNILVNLKLFHYS